MKQLPFVSVVVPIFMVDKYLHRCISSLVNQTYYNIEIILVDDGSLDSCGTICDKWAQEDSRVIVIHQNNGKLSDARNKGLRIATGEYIGFIDSDDYVSEDYCETMLNVLITHESDIVECDVIRFNNNGEYFKKNDDYSIVDFATVEGLSELIADKDLHQMACNKILRAEIIRGIDFPLERLHEDEFWSFLVFGKANSISKINKSMYYYYQRVGSIMGSNYSLGRLDAIEGRWRRHQYIIENYPILSTQSRLCLFGTCIYAFQCVIKYMSGKDKRKAGYIIRNYKKRCDLSFKDIQKIKGPQKKYFFLAKINLYLCCKIRSIFGIGF